MCDKELYIENNELYVADQQDVKQIRFLLDYGQYPIWFVDSEGGLKNGIPEELPYKLKKCLLDITDEYIDLYINNAHEFSFKGFDTDVENEKFKQKITKAFNKVQRFYGDRYEVKMHESVQDYLN